MKNVIKSESVNTQFIDQTIVQSLLDQKSSQIFTVYFLKKDGSPRSLNGILRDSPASHASHQNLFCVETFKPASVRSVDKSRILRISKSGFKIESIGFSDHFKSAGIV